MRLQQRSTRRPGATLLETGIVFGVFLGLALGMLDLGIAVFRYHLLSQAARHGARQAMIHGSLAPATVGSWGPGTINVAANTSGVPLVDAVKPFLIGFDLSKTQVLAEWLDGGIDADQRVRVTITTSYQPATPIISGTQPLTLRAASTLAIVH